MYVYSGTSLIRTPLGQTKVSLINREVSLIQRLLNVAFGTDESVLFREVSLIIEGVLIERFHCICIATIERSTTSAVQSSLLSHAARTKFSSMYIHDEQ